MATQTCRDVITVISRYFHPLKAQLTVERYCDDIDLSLDIFSVADLSEFILYVAAKRGTFTSVDDNRFSLMLRDMIYLSNSENVDVNSEKTHPYMVLGKELK